ncbi:hypothetical protein HMPREF9374_1060 [Desmospora sp. 8437]|jgi:hypothetical protein|uniref:Zinc-ribbon domain-containing protein n=1 Tax=Kroppenstedtia guangzhouensis TaxID=1274356 RepID=A0ABQ1FW62_9BACL|nr:hypothetical protein [Kroppenstedtia guangzhouensis]EGK13068.1 hypothetical protein HMPREF9374_1060 [Desmospora sp. 8437]GGA32389.1 hypothetical protein GCM10007416_01200 [Kroppenstedtia guangzhouensis]
MRGREFWVAILLFCVGGGCLVTAVQLSPFGPVSASLVPFLRSLRVSLWILLTVILIRMLLRSFRYPGGENCRCGKRLERDWSYCPKCGRKLTGTDNGEKRDPDEGETDADN